MKIIFLFIIALFLISCSGAETVKREPVAPPVSEKFEVRGHLEPEDNLNEKTKTKGLAPIPEVIELQAINLDPSQHQQQKQYSVSAIDVPASDLLFNLAVDAKKQLDISTEVQGNVTLNAINQPLETILKRIVEQVDALYELDGDIIIIRKDRPYWHTYKVDYVNVSKDTQDSTVMKMAVGNIGGAESSNAGGGSGQDRASKFKKEVVSRHDFWGTLLANIKSIAVIQKDQESSLSASPTQNNNENVVLNREAGLISVRTSAQRHRMIRSYLNEVKERTTKQVLIEVTVVEVELSDQYQAGVDWSASNTTSERSTTIAQNLLGANLSSDPNFTVNLASTGSWNFSLGVRLLQQFGDVKVLSSPKIMAMNNQSALLKVVDNEVYFTVDVDRESATSSGPAVTTFETQVHTVPVGFMMNMTPFITNDGDISINIRPTLTRIVGYVNDPNPELARESVVSRIPIIQEREMDSVLRLRNRQTAIIGGLIQDYHKDERKGIPVLMDIPWLGDLFAYRDDTVRKTELIIFLRPVIVNNPDIENGDLRQVKQFLQTRTN